MKTYQRTRLAQAAKVTGVYRQDDGSVMLAFEGDDPFAVSAAYAHRHSPHPGGYYVAYPDGYASFCPGDVFERDHIAVGASGPMDFGDALRALRAGIRVARAGWDGKGMWLAYSPGSDGLAADKFWAGPNRQFAEENGGSADVLPCITMKTADGKILMGWLASQSDMLADDWVLVAD